MTPLAVLTVSGSDSSAGSGVQGDLKVFAAMRLYGASVVTAVTSQNTKGVQDVFPMPRHGGRRPARRGARRHADQRGQGRHAGDRRGGGRGDREGALRPAAQPGHRPGAVVVDRAAGGRVDGDRAAAAVRRRWPRPTARRRRPWSGGRSPRRPTWRGRRRSSPRTGPSTSSSPAATWSRATRRSTRCGPTRAPGSCATRGCSAATATARGARSRRPSRGGWRWATRCRTRWSTPRSTWPGRCSTARDWKLGSGRGPIDHFGWPTF